MIKCIDLSKKYTKNTSNEVSSIRELFSKPFYQKDIGKQTSFWALKNINLEILRSDVVGLLGRNGAGKTTLLKILSQVTLPTEGKVEINGRICSMLGAACGFHPDLTGLENIYFSGAILGLSKKIVKKELDNIISFSGVSEFIHTPVKRYSSGMRSRLGFAISTFVLPEILILDEVLAVGDLEFQEKALKRVREISKSGQTIIYVSHNLDEIAQICNKAIVLERGMLMFYGEVKEGINFYEKMCFKNII